MNLNKRITDQGWLTSKVNRFTERQLVLDKNRKNIQSLHNQVAFYDILQLNQGYFTTWCLSHDSHEMFRSHILEFEGLYHNSHYTPSK